MLNLEHVNTVILNNIQSERAHYPKTKYSTIAVQGTLHIDILG